MLGTWGSVGAYIAGQLPSDLDPSASDRHIWQICAYMAAALTGILLIFTLVLIRRIKVCVARSFDACRWFISLRVSGMPRLQHTPESSGTLHAYGCSSDRRVHRAASWRRLHADIHALPRFRCSIKRYEVCHLQVAVACIKVASQAVAAIPTLLFWPLAPFLAICCLVAYWVAVAAFLYSASSIVPRQLQASSTDAYSLSVSISLTALHTHLGAVLGGYHMAAHNSHLAQYAWEKSCEVRIHMHEAGGACKELSGCMCAGAF